MLVLKSTVLALSRLRSTVRGDLLVPRTKTKMIGPGSFATSGPVLWNNLPAFWGTLPWVYLFSKKDWNRIRLNNVDVRYRLNWHLPPHVFQLMHLHSVVRSNASKEVTFTLHYITSHVRSTWSHKRGAGSHKRGAGSHKRGNESHKRSAGFHKRGAGSNKRGTGSHKRGAGSHKRGTESHKRGAESHKWGTGSHKRGARSNKKGWIS